MSNAAHPFDLEHYSNILNAIKNSDYRVELFTDTRATEKVIYIRHDIDNDIPFAHKMATIEAEHGIRSTYLVLLRSGNYNPAERVSTRLLREMKEMGHDIGLHFSLIDHPLFECSYVLPELICADAKILSAVIDQDVTVFGFHNPEKKEQFQVNVDGLTNTYSPKFFDDAYYTSESNMAWKKGCPCSFPAHVDSDVVQLLVHPLSFAGNLKNDFDVLVDFVERKLRYLVDYNAQCSRTLSSEKNLYDKVVAAINKDETYDK